MIIRFRKPEGFIHFFILIFFFSCIQRQPEEICDFQRQCTKDLNKIKVRLDIEPKPLQAFRETEFIVTITGTDKIYDELLLDLNMPGMFMGKNQVVLKRDDKNKYKGKGIIPRCPTGKTLWKADIFIPHEGTVSFRFHVR